MYIIAQYQEGGTRYLVNLNSAGTLKTSSQGHELNAGNWVIASNYQDSDVNLADRFLDICEALDAGNVNVYDCNKAVGFWKPAPKKSAGPKKAPAPK